MKKTIVGLGEALFDCLPEGSKLGGAPANFAYHTSQFGFDAVAISALGKDMWGDLARREFDAKGLHYIMPEVEQPTGTVQVELDDEGVPTYDIKQNVAWDNIPFTPEIEKVAKKADCVCFGSLAQRSPVSANTISRFLDATKPECLKIFDINLRQTFYTKDVIESSLHRCNILKINDEELITLGRMYGYPGLELENKCWLILGKYDLDMLVLTCGTNGSYVFTPGESSFQPTPKVDVADTVGAGDSFTATFAAALLSGLSMPKAHELAVNASAYVCTQKGAMPEFPDEIKNAIQKEKE